MLEPSIRILKDNKKSVSVGYQSDLLCVQLGAANRCGTFPSMHTICRGWDCFHLENKLFPPKRNC